MSKKPTDQDIDSLFEGIDAPSTNQASSAVNAPPPSTAQAPDDLFDDLIPRRSEHTSRPHTPRVQSNVATPALRGSPIKRPGTATPPSSEGTGTRNSEEKAQLGRKSGESTRSFHKSFTPGSTEGGGASPDEKVAKEQEAAAAAQNAEMQAQSSGGGWWGGIFATASAAVKQAEALAKEVQKSEEAQRWAEQVKGNVGALRGFGKLRSTSKTKDSYRCMLTATKKRWPTLLPRPSHIHQYPTHPRPTNLFPRTTPNPHNS